MSNKRQGDKLMGVFTIGIVVPRLEDLKDSRNKIPSHARVCLVVDHVTRI